MDAVELLVAGLSGGLVVLSGGIYALLFALGRLRGERRLSVAAYAAYVVLAAAALCLTLALRLSPAWQGVIVLALIGYLLLPQAIWHLCESTHAESTNAQEGPARNLANLARTGSERR